MITLKGYLFWWNQLSRAYEGRHLGMEIMLLTKFGQKPGVKIFTAGQSLWLPFTEIIIFYNLTYLFKYNHLTILSSPNLTYSSQQRRHCLLPLLDPKTQPGNKYTILKPIRKRFLTILKLCWTDIDHTPQNIAFNKPHLPTFTTLGDASGKDQFKQSCCIQS